MNAEPADVAIERVNPNWSVEGYNLYPNMTAPKASSMNNANVFSAAADNAARAIMFVEWVEASQSNYDLLIYGIEGTHYNPVGAGQYEVPEGVATPHPYIYNTGLWGFWNINYHRFDAELEPGFRERYIEDVNNPNNRYYPHAGFIPNYDPIKTQVAQRQSAYEEMGKALDFGVLSPDNLDDYLDLQAGAGTDILVAELQRQLDEWRNGAE
jgi:putative aldouronate transport system substrate-binding protein